MKTFIFGFCFLLCIVALATPPAAIRQQMVTPTAAAPACTTPVTGQLNQNDNTPVAEFSGQINVVAPGSDSICHVRIYLKTPTGTGYAVIAKMSGNNLDLSSLNTTYWQSDTITLADGANDFTFSTPAAFSNPQAYGVAARVSVGSIYDASDAGSSWVEGSKNGNLSFWAADGTFSSQFTTYNAQYETFK